MCIAKEILMGCWWEINWHNHLRKKLRVIYWHWPNTYPTWNTSFGGLSPIERNACIQKTGIVDNIWVRRRILDQQSFGMVSSGDTRQLLDSLDLSGFSLSSSECWITDMRQYRTSLSLDSDRNTGRTIRKREEGSVSPAHCSILEWTVTMGWLSGHQWAKTDIVIVFIENPSSLMASGNSVAWSNLTPFQPSMGHKGVISSLSQASWCLDTTIVCIQI